MHFPVPEQPAGANPAPIADGVNEREATKSPRRSGWIKLSRALLLLLIGAGAGLLADRFIVAPAEEPVAAPAPKQAPLTRIGDRLVVPPGSPLRERLTIAEPELKEVAHTLVLPALVEPDPARTVKVLPPVAGRVTELKVRLGERVSKDQQLLVIDSGDLAQAYSDRDKARAALKLAKEALDRLMMLERSQAVAVKERQQAQNDFAQAQSELERSEDRLRAIGVSAEKAEPTRVLSVKSPIEGSIIDLQVAAGAYVNDPTAPMMTIANLDTIWVTANVPEKDIAFVYEGQPVDVTFPAYPDKVFKGKVLFVSDVIDPDTRRNKVRVAFDNPDKMMKANMFANAAFAAPSESRLFVPTSALLMTNDSTSVFVEVAEWAFERRNVEIAYQEGATAAIKSGVRPGDRVVIRGAVRLND
jgi:cobalt-zinc-cadmium efflux system membrane fusion protein